MRRILRRMWMGLILIGLLTAVISVYAAAAPLGATIILSEGGGEASVETAAEAEALDVTVTHDAFDVRFKWGELGGGEVGWIDITGKPYSTVTLRNNAAERVVQVGMHCDAASAPAGIERVGLSMSPDDVRYAASLAPFTLSPQANETVYVHYDYRAPSGHEGGSGSVRLTITLTGVTPGEPEA